jgi:hypothetical protein
MSAYEVFRIRLFAPGCVVRADELARRIHSAVQQVQLILKPYVSAHRISCETPVDGQGWLVVRIDDDSQMKLEFSVAQRAGRANLEEAGALGVEFRAHCQRLIGTIRRARLERQDLDDLYKEAVACHKSLARLASSSVPESMNLELLLSGALAWTPAIPVPPDHMRAVDEVLTVSFDIRSVGVHCAVIDLDRPSRDMLFTTQSKTQLIWKPLEVQTNTSTFLHRRMLRGAVVQASCSRLLKKSGQLHGLALHSLLK